ncbi:MAG: 2-phospho-L-lactate transferase [Pseudomonadota bacterium]
MTDVAARALRVTLLAGGVGGAKMAEGFAACPEVDLTVIGNVADDDEFHGLWVSPDIDTLIYSLAGRVNRDQGWGLADEGRRALDTLAELGADTWMFLGDRDFGVHIHRSARLAQGHSRSAITADMARALGVHARMVLPTDDVVQTRVRTDAGWQSFQEYFVRDRCAPEVREIAYEGLAKARPTAHAIEALANADLIVIAPSNPVVSIAPILGVPGLRTALAQGPAPVVAVSPLIGGRVVKGPADRMMRGLGLRADALGVAQGYRDLAPTMVIDHADAGLASEIGALAAGVHVIDTLMPDAAGKARLAREVLALASRPSAGGAAA